MIEILFLTIVIVRYWYLFFIVSMNLDKGSGIRELSFCNTLYIVKFNIKYVLVK